MVNIYIYVYLHYERILTLFLSINSEAQNIKNMKSRASKACAEISTVHRWCLTGKSQEI